VTDAIVAKQLTKRFGELEAVRNLSLSIEQGSIFGFLGPNGSGKSTTIKMLCGLVEPTSGEAFVNGFNVRRQGDEVRQSNGYMSQSHSLYTDLTVDEKLEFYGRDYGLDREPRAHSREQAL